MLSTRPSYAARAFGQSPAIRGWSSSCGGALRPICVRTIESTDQEQAVGSASSIVRWENSRLPHRAVEDEEGRAGAEAF